MLEILFLVYVVLAPAVGVHDDDLKSVVRGQSCSWRRSGLAKLCTGDTTSSYALEKLHVRVPSHAMPCCASLFTIVAFGPLRFSGHDRNFI